MRRKNNLNRFNLYIDIDGGWSSFGSYGDCSVSCGAGVSIRSRSCTKPKPSGDGSYCTGDAYETRKCTPSPCGM